MIGANRVTTFSSNNNLVASTTPQPVITINNQRSLPLTTLGGNQQRAGNTINQVSQCPTFDVGHKQDILIADGSEKELTIKVKNMPQFKVSNEV